MNRARLLAWQLCLCVACVAPAEPPPRLRADPVETASDRPRSAAGAEATAARAAIVAAGPTDIVLHDVGRGEPTILRRLAVDGSERRLTVQVDGRMNFKGDGAPLLEAELATITNTWRARVDAVTGDTAAVSLDIESASYDEAHSDARVRAATARAIDVLAPVRAKLQVPAAGAPARIDLAIAPRTPSDLRPGVEAALQVVPLLFIAVPAEPVGVGARWTAKSELAYAQLRLSQTADVEVVRRTPRGVELAFTIEHTMPAPSQADAGARAIEAHHAKFEGTLTLAPEWVIPVDIAAKGRVEMTSDVRSSGSPMQAVLVLDVELASVPAD